MSDELQDDFEDSGGPDGRAPEDAFVVDLDGFEGPIDVLLTLARDQKVDLAQISILELAISIWPSSPRRARSTSNWPPTIW